MKKTTTLLFAVLLFAVIQTTFAATININISGTTYSPPGAAANVGDVVNIQASGTHPLVQVDQTTWNANGNTPMSGGWGTQTANYTFTVTAGMAGTTIYFVCANHVSMQMKGAIAVATSSIQQVTAGAYNISLYPNPVSGSDFTVKMEGYTGNNGKVQLYDEMGRLLEVHNLTGVETAVKSKVPSGIYFYTVFIANEPVYQNKFVVEKSK